MGKVGESPPFAVGNHIYSRRFLQPNGERHCRVYPSVELIITNGSGLTLFDQIDNPTWMGKSGRGLVRVF